MKLFKFPTKSLVNPHVNPAPLGKRLGAFFLDVAAAALVMLLGFNAAVYPLWYHHLGGYEAHVALEEGKEASGLYSSPYVTFVTEDEEEIVVFDRAYRIDAEIFFDRESFRLDRTNPSSDLTADFRIVALTVTATEKEVHYFKAISNYYDKNNPYFEFLQSSYHTAENTTFDLFSDVYQVGQEQSLFAYVNHDENQITLRPDVSDEEVIVTIKNIYELAMRNLEKTAIYRTLRQPIVNVNIWGYAGSFLFGLLIFSFFLPLLLGDGRSLGKFLVGLGLVNHEGYRILWWQLLLRFLVFSLLEIILSIILFILPLLISSACFALNKKRQSLHDLIAKTVVIDWNNSRIFASEEEAKNWTDAIAKNQETKIDPSGGLRQPSP
ncbi:MAG: RDD family protein [Bacilli bacterium]|jgi:uncharacterized RDD family membrane protein YckC